MERYVPRMADAPLADMVASHQAVLVVGPRSCGKTTTASRLAASEIRLGQPSVANAVRTDPSASLRGLEPPVLIDEWQVVPDILSSVKEQLDANPGRGQFVLTGSARGDLDSPMWPGTGRLVQLSMFPLSEREVEHRHQGSWLNEVLHGSSFDGYRSDMDVRDYVERALRSGFPEPALRLDAPGAQQRWLASYVDQLVTRDAASLDGGRDLERQRRYTQALALNSAGSATDQTLWESARINKATAPAYDTLLKNLLVSFDLPAWTPNRLRRLTLAPKRFLVDPGLMAGVLHLSPEDVLFDADLLGRVIETFVAAQLRAELSIATPRRSLSHLRVQQGRHEIDFVIEIGPRRIVAIEVKATASPGPDDAKYLRWLRRELGETVMAAVLLHTGPSAIELDGGVIALPISTIWS